MKFSMKKTRQITAKEARILRALIVLPAGAVIEVPRATQRK